MLWWALYGGTGTGTGSGGGTAPSITSVLPTFSDLFADAHMRLRVTRAGDTMSPEDAAYLLLMFNSLIDQWNANSRAVYNDQFVDFTLTPGLSPHTIGPAGSGPSGADPSCVVTQRPIELKYAGLNVGGSPPSYTPITVRTSSWYARQPIPTMSADVPTDLYYSPDWTDPEETGVGYGALYFWGVPAVAYGVRLWMRLVLTRVTDPTVIVSLPPGYYEALVLCLCKKAAAGFGQPYGVAMEEDRKEACELVFGNNDEEPTISTADAGLGGSRTRGFNWMTRQSS